MGLIKLIKENKKKKEKIKKEFEKEFNDGRGAKDE